MSLSLLKGFTYKLKIICYYITKLCFKIKFLVLNQYYILCYKLLRSILILQTFDFIIEK